MKTELEKLYEEYGSTPEAALAVSRKLLSDQFKGVNESEAISYARGFTKGLKFSGKSNQEMELLLFSLRLEDKILDAGIHYLGLNMVESIVAKETAKKQ